MRPIVLAAAAAILAFPFPTDASEQTTACLAEAIYYEARGTEIEGQAAVAHVVLNRAEHDEFPGTPCGVVADGCQFSYRCDGSPVRMADEGDRSEAFETAERVLEGDLDDPTDGALFFHSADITSRWHRSRPHVGQFGGNVFYR